MRKRYRCILGQYLPYQEAAISIQTGSTRIVFEENTGLSKVWSVKFLREIIASESFKQQFKTVGAIRGGFVP